MHFRIENFSGIVPKISARLLPANNAVDAVSTELYTGELRGLKKPSFIRSVPTLTERAFKANIKDTADNEYKNVWVLFETELVEFYRGPNISDQYQRHYYTGPDQVPSVVNGNALLAADGDLDAIPVTDTNGPFKWGIPNPSPAPIPTVVPPASVPATDEVRSYTYTFVNAWGEESAPCTPSASETGDREGTWTVNGIQTTYNASGHCPLVNMRIYRTSTGSQLTNFRFVEEVPFAATYIDTVPSDVVALNEPLSTTTYDLPPSVGGTEDFMRGLVQMPNGVFAAFKDTDVFFSEPYKPYSWPPNYKKSVGTNIIGLGVFQSGLVICTDSNPQVLTGAHPANMTMIELDAQQPCLSAESIVSAKEGVYYASQNGVVMATEFNAQVISEAFITRTEWNQRYEPRNMRAAINGQGYIAIYTTSQGILIGTQVGNGAMIDIGNLSYIKDINVDPREGEVYVISNDGLYQWNLFTAEPLAWRWESRTFETKYPINFGAFKLKWDFFTDDDFSDDAIPAVDPSYYNSQILAYDDGHTQVGIEDEGTPLHTYAQFAYNTSELIPQEAYSNGATYPDPDPYLPYKVDRAGYPVEEFYPNVVRMALGDSDLIGERDNILTTGVRVTVLARRKTETEFEPVYSQIIKDEETHRLPAGFKADLWRIRMESVHNVYSFVIAETGRELKEI